MKCDKLKSFIVLYNGKFERVYAKNKVKAVIAELKQFAEDACLERDDNQTAIDELNEENRKLKRSLWIARANRALEKIAWLKLWNASISTMNPEDSTRQEFDKWKKALGKFLEKAKEYR